MNFTLIIIQALLFYLLPTLIGRSIVNFFIKKNILYPFISYFITGALTIYLSVNITYYFSSLIFQDPSYQPIFYLTLGLLSFICLPANLFFQKNDFKGWKNYIKPTLASFIFTLLTYSIWHIKSPLPFNWDILEHQLLANEILKGNFSFFTTSISDTFGFNGYSSFFHTLLAATQITHISGIFIYHHVLGILHATLVSLSAFLLTKELINSKKIAYLALILSALTFDSSVSYSTLFIIPQTFTASIFILLFTQLIATVKQNKAIQKLQRVTQMERHPDTRTGERSEQALAGGKPAAGPAIKITSTESEVTGLALIKKLTSILKLKFTTKPAEKSTTTSASLPHVLIASSLIFILLNHYAVGTVAVAIYLSTLLYFQYRQRVAKHLNITYSIQIILLLAIIVTLIAPSIPLNFLNKGEAANFTLNITQKFNISTQIYGYLLFLFAPIGAISIIKRKKELQILTLTISLLLLSLVLLELPYMLKFYVLARPFIHILMAIGIFATLKLIKNKILKTFSVILLLVSLLIILITNASSWKDLLRYQNSFTNIAQNELQAAEFLKNNYQDKGFLLVSDPATQHIFEMLTSINTQGGAYMSAKSRTLLNSAEKANNPAFTASALYQIQDNLDQNLDKRIFLTSGRYFLWQESSEIDKFSLSYNIWYPADLNLENKLIINNLRNNPHFNLIYQNDTLTIFEVEK